VFERDFDAFVRSGMSKAEKQEFGGRTLTTFYLECMAILGPNFETDSKYPWAGEILRRTDLIPESKADLLDQNLTFNLHHPA
jgi:hypothetical protein